MASNFGCNAYRGQHLHPSAAETSTHSQHKKQWCPRGPAHIIKWHQILLFVIDYICAEAGRLTVQVYVYVDGGNITALASHLQSYSSQLQNRCTVNDSWLHREQNQNNGPWYETLEHVLSRRNSNWLTAGEQGGGESRLDDEMCRQSNPDYEYERYVCADVWALIKMNIDKRTSEELLIVWKGCRVLPVRTTVSCEVKEWAWQQLV